jgi:hypothetical protein
VQVLLSVRAIHRSLNGCKTSGGVVLASCARTTGAMAEYLLDDPVFLRLVLKQKLGLLK